MTDVKLLDADGNPLASTKKSMVAHSAADRNSQELASWIPRSKSADGAWLPDRDLAVSRIQDLARNDGWASGALRTKLINVLGSRMKLQVRPDYRALGLDYEWSVEWSRDVEARFANYAEDPDYHCDIRQLQSVYGIVQTAFCDFLTSGDAIALAHWLPRNGGQFATTFQGVDADRLSNPHEKRDTEHLKGGIETDRFGRPAYYHFRNAHPGDRMVSRNSYSWSKVSRKTKFGRLKVIHYFRHERPGQTRGKSMFTPIIERLKMHTKHSRTALQAAVLNCVLAAFIESPVDTGIMGELFEGGEHEQVLAYQDGRAEFHKNRGLKLNGVQVPQLFPGEKFSFSSVSHPGPDYAQFEQAVLRNIAAGLGISYEQLSNNWSDTNYSSARASLLEAWKVMTFERLEFSQHFIRHMYGLWLEEAIYKGIVKLPATAPSFQTAKAAYMRCRLIGPPRGWVDPVKEAQASQLRMEIGISSLEQECAEQGLDYEEVLDQRARELKMLKEKGLSAPSRFIPQNETQENQEQSNGQTGR